MSKQQIDTFLKKLKNKGDDIDEPYHAYINRYYRNTLIRTHLDMAIQLESKKESATVRKPVSSNKKTALCYLLGAYVVRLYFRNIFSLYELQVNKPFHDIKIPSHQNISA